MNWPVELGYIGTDFLYDRQAAKIHLQSVTLEHLLDGSDMEGVVRQMNKIADHVREGAGLPDDSFVMVRIGSGQSWTFLGDGCGPVPPLLVEELACVGPRCREFQRLRAQS